jgi:endoglucanase
VSEALFNLDCYRRMQTEDGGIRGGIESSEHPRHGEASWQESLTVMAYAPGVWSSHVYAGVAARAAYVLQTIDRERAQLYLESALRAMEWAERELPGRAGRDDPHAVNDDRNLAAAELFRATGDERWHRIFLETTALRDPQADLFLWQSHDQAEAAWVYVRTERPGQDAQLRANCRNALLRQADERVSAGEQTGFRWAKYTWRPTGTGSLTAPDGVPLVRAHLLTGEAKYLRTVVLACQTGGGANPLNICYTTGLGHESPQHPLHVDSRISGQPAPPGLTVFGPCNPEQMGQDWAIKFVDQTCYPPSREWPIIEAYWDVFWYLVVCEFTVQTPMAANAYTWGYLAARP